MSQRFSDAGHDCPVLNAVNHALEAEIIAEAGQSGRITISTNIAGHGTDILLDDAARTAGGLHVILTELHTSLRFDRQLIGGSARQGDPGSFEYLLSLEDSLLTTYAPGLQRKLKAKVAWHGRKLPSSWLKYFLKTQRQLEKRIRAKLPRTNRLGIRDSGKGSNRQVHLLLMDRPQWQSKSDVPAESFQQPWRGQTQPLRNRMSPASRVPRIEIDSREFAIPDATDPLDCFTTRRSNMSTTGNRKAYNTDLTEQQWEIVEPTFTSQ